MEVFRLLGGWKMKASVIVTLDDGRQLHGEAELSEIDDPKAEERARPLPLGPHFDFHLGARAFMKRYGASLSGPKRFALLLAHLSKGSVGQEIAMKDLESAWNKMKAIMGGPYNSAYAVRAKDEGWVDSSKRGSYTLLSSWRGA
jgi:hypothetical protein